MNIIELFAPNCRNCRHCVPSCPTKTISFASGRPEIIKDECILCGKCYTVCPHEAKQVVTDLENVIDWIKNKQSVVLSMDGAWLMAWSNFPELKRRCLEYGFKAVEETAKGAVEVGNELGYLLQSKRQVNILDTNCPSSVRLVETMYPDLIPQLAPLASVMVVHGRMLKEQYGDQTKVVYVSPCIARIGEGKNVMNQPVIDGVISIQDLVSLIGEDLSEVSPQFPQFNGAISRAYPMMSGMSKMIDRSNDYQMIYVEGVDRIIDVLNSVQKGRMQNFYIQMSTCMGSCLGGNLVLPYKSREWKAQSLIRAGMLLESRLAPIKSKYHVVGHPFNRSVKHQQFTKTEIREVMLGLGRFTPADELNCGACGYNTCYEKAIAVLEGKADPKLCMAYAMKEANSIAKMVVQNTPNGIIVLNRDLSVREVNPAARKYLLLETQDVTGLPVKALLDNDNLAMALTNATEQATYIVEEYPSMNRIFSHAIFRITDLGVIVILLMDMTDEINQQQQQLNEYLKQTLAVTQQVIDEQMRTVQEIASLLGESTVKSKLALTKLKKKLDNE
jgi:iron only hydrogenase large subunit-like protein/uncharacterized Fe-S cluster-containing protein